MKANTNLKAGLLQGEPVRSSCRKLGSILLLIVISALPFWAQNDPFYNQQWGLSNYGQPIGFPSISGTPGASIHAWLAWGISTGSDKNVVAVLDTGIDYTHPDLVANVWSAPTEFTVTINDPSCIGPPFTGGCLSSGQRTITCPKDTHGFDFTTNSCDPMDHAVHGTAVAGIIGAVGNNGLGVVGVNWKAKIMALKIFERSNAETGTVPNAIKAIEFAVQVKKFFQSTGGANVRVLNNSWGWQILPGQPANVPQGLFDAITLAGSNDMLFVADAGENLNGPGLNNENNPEFPGGLSSTFDNVVSVAASDSTDHLWPSSNYGSGTVSLAAPGVNILTPVLPISATERVFGRYNYQTGTSFAAPHVSGAALLILSACNEGTGFLKQHILDNVDRKQSFSGMVASGGRLSVYNAMIGCFDQAMRKWTSVNDSRFQYIVPGTFQHDPLGWERNDPGWTYCSEDWGFLYSSLFVGPRAVTLYLATYKADPSLHYVNFYDPRIYKWTGWQRVP